MARKDKMVDDKQKYDMLQDKYSEKIINLLGLCTEIFVDHKENLYKIMTYLVDQIFTEMCKNKPKEIGPIIKKSSTDLLKKLNIDNWDKKKAKNIFNLEQNIDRLIDHMLITDILYDRNINDKLEGVDGIITYLKFSDGVNLQAILTGENYTRPIYDSDAFMGLRRTIDNVKEVLEANIIWYNDRQVIRVKHDMSSPQYLFVFSTGTIIKENLNMFWKNMKKLNQETLIKFKSWIKDAPIELLHNMTPYKFAKETNLDINESTSFLHSLYKYEFALIKINVKCPECKFQNTIYLDENFNETSCVECEGL